MSIHKKKGREHIFDFLRSGFMLFAFLHHFFLTIPGNIDYIENLNPFAELFVGLAGFMVGMIYLHRNKDLYLLKRGMKILLAFYIVAIPFTISKSLFIDKSNQPVQDILFNVIFMLEDPTAIFILRFYGLIFIMLPIILWIYRRLQIATLIISLLIFFISSIIYYQNSYQDNFFVTQTLMMLLQWQLFFVIGLKLGDLYKNNQLKQYIPTFRNCYLVLAPICLIIHIIWFKDTLYKFPYSYGKLLNSIYLVPLYLYIFCLIYNKIKGRFADKFIRVIGRNSLVAFVLSEVIRILFIKMPVTVLNIKLNEISSFFIALIMSILLIGIMWGYEHIKKSKKLSQGLSLFKKLEIFNLKRYRFERNL